MQPWLSDQEFLCEHWAAHNVFSLYGINFFKLWRMWTYKRSLNQVEGSSSLGLWKCMGEVREK